MIGTLPGTTIEVDLARQDAAEHILAPLFLAGGLTLSQVSQLTGLEPYVIQNWVKRGFVSPPENKRYSRRQFCRLALINMLKDCLQLDKITRLLSYLNGRLDDESDDRIEDDWLYLYVTQLFLRAEQSPLAGAAEWRAWSREILTQYDAPSEDARERVAQVLHIIITAYTAGRLKAAAEQMLRGLEGGT